MRPPRLFFFQVLENLRSGNFGVRSYISCGFTVLLLQQYMVYFNWSILDTLPKVTRRYSIKKMRYCIDLIKIGCLEFRKHPILIKSITDDS